jgi:hypothetical protein
MLSAAKLLQRVQQTAKNNKNAQVKSKTKNNEPD